MINGLKRKHVKFYVNQILAAGRLGTTIEMFLLDMDIRKSAWDKYSQKHKELRLAMLDAQEFCKAVALKKVKRLMHDKFLNSTVAKMYLENTAGWGITSDITDKTPPTVIIRLGKTSEQMKKEKR